MSVAFKLGTVPSPEARTKEWDRFCWYTDIPPEDLAINLDQASTAIAWRLGLYTKLIAWLHYKEHTTHLLSGRVVNDVMPHFDDLFVCSRELNPYDYDSVMLDHAGFYLVRLVSATFPNNMWHILESQLAVLRMRKALSIHKERHIHIVPGATFPALGVVEVEWTQATWPVRKRLAMVANGRARVAKAQWQHIILQHVTDCVLAPLQRLVRMRDERLVRCYKRMCAYVEELRRVDGRAREFLDTDLVQRVYHHDLQTHPVMVRRALKRERTRLQQQQHNPDGGRRVQEINNELASAAIGIVDIEDLVDKIPPCMQGLLEKTHYVFAERQAMFQLFLSAGADEDDVLVRVKRCNTIKYQRCGMHTRQIASELKSISKTWRHYKRCRSRHPNRGPFSCVRLKGLGLCPVSQDQCAERCGKPDMDGPLHYVQQMQGCGLFE